MQQWAQLDFNEFTEAGFENLLDMAKRKYRFIRYVDYKEPGKNILWRHDIDHSVHRAAKLAEIEYRNGVQGTYFINIHCEFYNVFELDITRLIDRILSLNHDIGLHFDPSYYQLNSYADERAEEWLAFEKEMLERLLQTRIQVVSFHNPTAGEWMNQAPETVAGMINTYSAYLMKNYRYCSDSNGFWRFQPLSEILTDEDPEKLQVLTHPEWWTPEAMSPRARITRCIEGRAESTHQRYDEFLRLCGRPNIGARDERL